jgi:hypothetical protein
MVTNPGTLDYTGYPVEVGVDFNQALENLNKSSETLDLPSSLRLVSIDGKEIPCQYDDALYKGKEDDTGNGKGTVVFVLDNLKSGSYNKYFFYFDTIEAGGIKRHLAYGGGRYHNGIKGLKIKSPEGDIGIPFHPYGVDRLGKRNWHFQYLWRRNAFSCCCKSSNKFL